MTSVDPGRGAHWKAEFRRLAAINVLSNLTVPLAGLADTAMLGRLPGAIDLAGVALAGLLFDLLYFGLGFLRMGTTGPVAQARGRGDETRQFHLLLRAAALALFLGLALVALRSPLSALTFSLLSGSPSVEAAGHSYLMARILGAPATLLNMVLLGWLLGRAQSGRALLVTVTQNGVNIALNAWFILILGLGAAGAGWATAAGQYAGAVLGIALVIRQLAPGLSWKGLWAVEDLRQLLALNRDLFVRTICLLAAFTAFTELSARMGTTLLAANAVLLRVLSLGSYWIDGLAYATEVLVGTAHGAGDSTQRHAVLRTALWWAAVVAAAVAVPASLAPHLTLHWMVLEPQVQAEISRLSWWLLPTLVMGSAAYVLDGYFLGQSAGALLRNAMLASLLLFAVPAGLALLHRSADLLWFAMVVLMAGRAVTLLRHVRW